MNIEPLKFSGVAFLVAISLSSLAFAENHPFQDVVRKSFAENPIGPGFFMKSKSSKHRVEVCGDSCAYFEWSGNGNDERFWKFIVLYELKDGPGTDVAVFLPNVKTLSNAELIEDTFCSIKGEDISTIDCDWKSYSMSLKIKVGHSSYDEGNRCYANGITRKFAEQQKLEWTCSPMKPEESPFK